MRAYLHENEMKTGARRSTTARRTQVARHRVEALTRWAVFTRFTSTLLSKPAFSAIWRRLFERTADDVHADLLVVGALAHELLERLDRVHQRAATARNHALLPAA